MILDAMLLLLYEYEKVDPDSYRNVQKVQLTHMILDAMLLLLSESEESDLDSYRDAQKWSLLT
jgi:hypothetical protein